VILRRPVSPLRLARTSAGLRIVEVAALVGASDVSVWRWENGWHRPWPATRKRLCKVFGLPEDVLFPESVEVTGS
jgi:transcriptional regulator with XRE-family HTH domain